jgi:hypothetical protein
MERSAWHPDPPARRVPEPAKITMGNFPLRHPVNRTKTLVAISLRQSQIQQRHIDSRMLEAVHRVKQIGYPLFGGVVVGLDFIPVWRHFGKVVSAQLAQAAANITLRIYSHMLPTKTPVLRTRGKRL